MKIIIDTDKKELKAEDVVTMGQLYEFLEKHGLMDYGLLGVDSNKPSVFPVKFKPDEITSTSGEITVNHNQNTDFGYRFINPNKYTVGRIPGLISRSRRTEIRVDQDIEPITPKDGF